MGLVDAYPHGSGIVVEAPVDVVTTALLLATERLVRVTERSLNAGVPPSVLWQATAKVGGPDGLGCRTLRAAFPTVAWEGKKDEIPG